MNDLANRLEYICELQKRLEELEAAIEELIIKWEKEYRKWKGSHCVNTDYCEAILSDLKELQKVLEGKE